ncbi:MAG: NUDIX domain-containing protein [Candidatus Binatia bacterium]
MSAAEELVDVVDEADRVLRRATRAEMRRDNLLHRAVYILVRGSYSDLFVHRRTITKDVYPGYWDVTVGGVVGAGEDYDTAARRELAEEIGVECDSVEPLFAVRYQDASTQLIGRAYLARHDGPLRLQVEEIAYGSFVTLAEAERIIRDEPCCPDGVQVLRRYLAERGPTTS